MDNYFPVNFTRNFIEFSFLEFYREYKNVLFKFLSFL